VSSPNSESALKVPRYIQQPLPPGCCFGLPDNSTSSPSVLGSQALGLLGFFCLFYRQCMETGYECACGRSFLQPGALTKHRRTCISSKKRLSSALEQAKRLWKGPKRRRVETLFQDPNQPPGTAAGLVLESDLVAPIVSTEVRSSFVRNDDAIFA
jgi:hypothetical protein